MKQIIKELNEIDQENKDFYNRIHYGFEDQKQFEAILEEIEQDLFDDDEDDFLITEDF